MVLCWGLVVVDAGSGDSGKKEDIVVPGNGGQDGLDHRLRCSP